MGLGALKTAWQRQTKDFGHTRSSKYACLIIDNRGMGESDKPLQRYSTSQMASDVVDVLEELGWTERRQLHVIGISMGGMIAQEIVGAGLGDEITNLCRCSHCMECSVYARAKE